MKTINALKPVLSLLLAVLLLATGVFLVSAAAGKALPAAARDLSPFMDVSPSDYFYDAVLWAVEQNITTGTTSTTFSPSKPCTRAQIVTFLWRAFREPEPQSAENYFLDVPANKYYTKPVLWAAEQGITSGTGPNTFSPGKYCTRGQIVTFLWRACGSPPPSGDTNPFTDVAPADYYYQAVLWAVEHGITRGTTDTTFSPKAYCTRGQAVAFLYNARVELGLEEAPDPTDPNQGTWVPVP